jgi:hypothetical protein
MGITDPNTSLVTTTHTSSIFNTNYDSFSQTDSIAKPYTITNGVGNNLDNAEYTGHYHYGYHCQHCYLQERGY